MSRKGPTEDNMRDAPQYDSALNIIYGIAAMHYIRSFNCEMTVALGLVVLATETFRVLANWRETRRDIVFKKERHIWTEQKHKHLLGGGEWKETGWEAEFDETIGVGTPEYKRPYPHLDEEDDK